MFNYRLLLWLFPIFPLTQMCCSQEVTGEEKMEQKNTQTVFFFGLFFKITCAGQFLAFKIQQRAAYCSYTAVHL